MRRKRILWKTTAAALSLLLLLSACQPGGEQESPNPEETQGETAEPQGDGAGSPSPSPEGVVDSQALVEGSEGVQESNEKTQSGERAAGLYLYCGEELVDVACEGGAESHEEGDGYMVDGEIEPHTHPMQESTFTLLNEKGEVLAKTMGGEHAIDLLGAKYALIHSGGMEGSSELMNYAGEVLFSDLSTARYIGGNEEADILFVAEFEGGAASILRIGQNGETETLYSFEGHVENVFERNEAYFAHIDGNGRLEVFAVGFLLSSDGAVEALWSTEGANIFQWLIREELEDGAYRNLAYYQGGEGAHFLCLDGDSQPEIIQTALPENSRVGLDSWAAVQTGALWGYVDVEGKEVIAPTFAEAQAFYGDMAVVAMDSGDQLDQEKFGFYDADERFYLAIDRNGEDIGRKNGGAGMAFDSMYSYGGFLVGKVEDTNYIITRTGEMMPLALSEEQLTVEGKVGEFAGFAPQYMCETTIAPLTVAVREDQSVYYTGLYDVAASNWVAEPLEDAYFSFYSKESLTNSFMDVLCGSIEEDIYFCSHGAEARFYDAYGVEIPGADARLNNMAVNITDAEENGLRWADGSWLYLAPEASGE